MDANWDRSQFYLRTGAGHNRRYRTETGPSFDYRWTGSCR